MSDITYKDVLDKVIELGKADPDFVYSNQPGVEYDGGCYYTAGNEEGQGRPCIIGQALIDLGVPVNHLKKFDEEYAEMYLPMVLGKDESNMSDEEASTLELIQSIQYSQDAGTPWGKAVESTVDDVTP